MTRSILLLVTSLGLVLGGLIAVVGWHPVVEGALTVEPKSVVFDGADEIDDVATIRILNSGTVPIRLLGVTSSCGCTLADPIEQPDLPPGASTELRIRGTPPTSGERRSFVDLECSLPQAARQRIEVLLKGKPIPIPYVKHAPDHLVLRSHRQELREVTFEVETIEHSGSPDWLTSTAESPAPFSMAFAGRQEAPVPNSTHVQRTYRFAVTAPVTPGPLQEARADLITTRGQPIAIKLTSEHVPALHTVPAALFWQLESESRLPSTRQIDVVRSEVSEASAETSFHLVPPQEDWLKVERIPINGPDTRVLARIQVTIVSLPPRGGAPSKLVLGIESSHSDCPRLDVPIVVRLLPSN